MRCIGSRCHLREWPQHASRMMQPASHRTHLDTNPSVTNERLRTVLLVQPPSLPARAQRFREQLRDLPSPSRPPRQDDSNNQHQSHISDCSPRPTQRRLQQQSEAPRERHRAPARRRAKPEREQRALEQAHKKCGHARSGRDVEALERGETLVKGCKGGLEPVERGVELRWWLYDGGGGVERLLERLRGLELEVLELLGGERAEVGGVLHCCEPAWSGTGTGGRRHDAAVGWVGVAGEVLLRVRRVRRGWGEDSVRHRRPRGLALATRWGVVPLPARGAVVGRVRIAGRVLDWRLATSGRGGRRRAHRVGCRARGPVAWKRGCGWDQAARLGLRGRGSRRRRAGRAWIARVSGRRVQARRTGADHSRLCCRSARGAARARTSRARG